MSPVSAFSLAWVVLSACLAIVAAVGVWLAQARADDTAQTTATQLLCVMLALLAFFATGFAFAMGGVRGDLGVLGPVTGLGREWAPSGPGRGLLGLEGFFLSGAANDPSIYGLFISHTALLLIAAVIGVASWASHAPRSVAAIYSILFGGALYPIFANWVWGGGWLSQLGQTAGLGHGVIDFAGAGVINAAAGLAALGAFLALRPREDDNVAVSSARLPAIGLVLAGAGWIGVIALNLHALANTRLAMAATNPLVALVCAATVALLYTWFAGGEPDLSIGVFAGLAGLAAAAGGAPFYPVWAAAIVGGVAGLLTPLAGFLFQRVLRRRDGALLVAAHGIGGLWGLLALGLLADGRFGAGVNGIGEREYLAAAGRGVTGLWPAGLGPSDPGQFKAQLVGCAVLFAFAVLTWFIVRFGRWLARQ